MYCPKCGTLNSDDRQICSNCSWVLSSMNAGTAADAKTSGLAITSLVLGILCFFTFFLTALPAMIFGIIALVSIGKSGGRLKGKGLAIAGLCIPLAILPIALAILMPALNKTRHLAYRMVCGSNVSGIANAMRVYSNDYYDKYPTPSRWCDLLMQHADVSQQQFVCKGADGKSSEKVSYYAMNAAVADYNVSEIPADMVVLFETKAGWNQVGGSELLTSENHAGDGANILFGDNHCEFVQTKEFNNLKWMPEGISF